MRTKEGTITRLTPCPNQFTQSLAHTAVTETQARIKRKSAVLVIQQQLLLNNRVSNRGGIMTEDGVQSTNGQD